MSKALKVRFVHNFVLTVLQTVEDEQGRLVVQEKQFHISQGDVYQVSQYEVNPDGRADLYFPDSSPLAGVAHNVEGDYMELRNSATKPAPTGGCGGCNKNR